MLGELKGREGMVWCGVVGCGNGMGEWDGMGWDGKRGANFISGGEERAGEKRRGRGRQQAKKRFQMLKITSSTSIILPLQEVSS